MNHRELKSEVPKVGFDSGPLSGSPNCASFEQSVNYYLALRSYQVRCFLQWAKVISSRAAKEPLFIDFDETAMKFNYAKLKGLIISKKHLPPGKNIERNKSVLQKLRRLYPSWPSSVLILVSKVNCHR